MCVAILSSTSLLASDRLKDGSVAGNNLLHYTRKTHDDVMMSSPMHVKGGSDRDTPYIVLGCGNACSGDYRNTL